MSVVASGQPGDTLRATISLTSLRQDAAQRVQGRLRALQQSTNGQWTFVDSPDPAKVDPRSCLPWTALEPDSVAVEPQSTGKLPVVFRIPQRARGSYYGALLLATERPAGTGIGIVFQFLVTLIVNVQGPPARQAVRAGEPSLQSITATLEHRADTVLHVPFSNEGETYEEAAANVTLFWQQSGKWRKVTGVDYQGQRLLPGSSVVRDWLLGKTLPLGHYKVQCSLRLGGTLKSRTEREFDFEGSPGVTEAACDVDLVVEPAGLSLRSMPGARVGLPLKILNTGDAPVDVVLGTQTPRSLQGVIMGQLKGDALSCAPWLRLSPMEFTIPPRATRSIRVDTEWPADQLDLPVRYAEVVVNAKYADGDAAGQAVIPVELRDKTATVEPKAQGESLLLAAGDTGTCAVNAKFLNVGLTAWSGKVVVALRPAKGERLAGAAMDLDRTVVLPLGRLQCNGALDVSKVPDGVYCLIAQLTYDEKADRHVELAIDVLVRTLNGRKTVIAQPHAPPDAPSAK